MIFVDFAIAFLVGVAFAALFSWTSDRWLRCRLRFRLFGPWRRP